MFRKGMLAQGVLAIASLTFLVGCGGGLDNLAQSILYPHDDVNKRYSVPELPHEGLRQLYFDHVDEAGEAFQTHAWYHVQPRANAKALVYFHGNGENLEALYQSNFLGVLQNLGFHFIAIDYPSYGRSTGTPNEPNILAGATAAIDWAKSNFPRSQIIVWGRSLGASVAMKSAETRQNQIHRLILTSPWSNFYEVALDKTGLIRRVSEEWLSKNTWDSLDAASRFTRPTLIHHGDMDKVIPIKFGLKLFESFPSNTPVRFEVLTGREHNDIFADSTFWEHIRDFGLIDNNSSLNQRP